MLDHQGCLRNISYLSKSQKGVVPSPLGQKRLSYSEDVAHTSNVHTHAHVIWHEQPAYHHVCHLSSTCQTDGLLEMTDRLQTEMCSSNIQAKRMCLCIFCVYLCLSVCLCEQEKSGGLKKDGAKRKMKD